MKIKPLSWLWLIVKCPFVRFWNTESANKIAIISLFVSTFVAVMLTYYTVNVTEKISKDEMNVKGINDLVSGMQQQNNKTSEVVNKLNAVVSFMYDAQKIESANSSNSERINKAQFQVAVSNLEQWFIRFQSFNSFLRTKKELFDYEKFMNQQFHKKYVIPELRADSLWNISADLLNEGTFILSNTTNNTFLFANDTLLKMWLNIRKFLAENAATYAGVTKQIQSIPYERPIIAVPNMFSVDQLMKQNEMCSDSVNNLFFRAYYYGYDLYKKKNKDRSHN